MNEYVNKFECVIAHVCANTKMRRKGVLNVKLVAFLRAIAAYSMVL